MARPRHRQGHEWYTTASVRCDANDAGKLLGDKGPAGTLLNGTAGRTVDLITDEKFSDFELYLEFLIPAKSNSGVYIAGL